MRIALAVVLFLLLGAAGYWWFDDEWYGWLTGAGIFALRVGPMFLWKTVLRVLRRQIFRVLLLLLPTSCKQPMRTARFAIRKSCGTLLGGLKRRWQESWMIRIAVLVPAIVALCVIAYDKEGIGEFMTLFAIPFLVTAIFPEGFWSYAIAFIMSYLASHGLEGVIEKLTGVFPRSLLETYREKRFDTLKAMVRHRRAAMEKTSDAFHAWKARRKHSEKTPPP
jgi:hypothetical protein